MVLWVWYGVTESDAIITVYIENLTESDFLPINISKACQIRSTITEPKKLGYQFFFQTDVIIRPNLSGLILYKA